MKKPDALPALEHPTLDAESIQRSLVNRLIYTIGKDPLTATDRDWFYAAAAVVRERLIERAECLDNFAHDPPVDRERSLRRGNRGARADVRGVRAGRRCA